MLRFCSLRPAISAHYLIYRAEVKAASRAGARGGLGAKGFVALIHRTVPQQILSGFSTR